MNKINVLTGFIFAFFVATSVVADDVLDSDYLGLVSISQSLVKNVSAAVTTAATAVGIIEPELTESDRREIECLARAMYFESHTEPVEGQLAVAHVIYNRLQSERYGNSICSVVHQRTGRTCQFSWYCSKGLKINRQIYARVEDLAERFYTEYESFSDMTRGALYFHADYVRTAWQGVQRTVKIGRHIFYRPRQKSKNK